ncbi:alkaline phosphatase family protein [Novipirellula sp.]|uniref:alkaline phosphatase family protein n=1 Tax=Novipirellula sp. TaxID=2795430 RepID=UPI0035682150
MRSKWFAFLALVLISPMLAVAADTPKVLFLGIDGCRFDALRKANTPNLDRLIDQGIYADNTRIFHPRYTTADTISGPGWSSILTGVWADKHGVLDNQFKVTHYDKFPHLFVRVKEQSPETKTASLVCWAPIDQYIVASADKRFSYTEKDYEERDDAATDEAVKQLSDGSTDVVFLYLGATDEAGHASGFHPANPKYVETIQAADAKIGRVLAAIESRASYQDEDWLVVVTSDHGGKGTSHSNGHEVPEIFHSFLIVSGDSAERGKFETDTYIVDAPATVLKHLGIDAPEHWQLDGKPVGLKK